MSRSHAATRTLTLFAEASPARTSASPVGGQDSAEPGLVFGSTSRGSSRALGRASSSSRTSPAAHDGGCPRCGATSANSATTPPPSGFLPLTSARPTSGDESSLLPTPSASSYGSNKGGAAGRTGKDRPSLDSMARRGLLLPTPTAHNAKETGAPGELRRNSPMLGTMAMHGQLEHPRGPLLPSFVEWMMGFPEGWTALDD